MQAKIGKMGGKLAKYFNIYLQENYAEIQNF